MVTRAKLRKRQAFQGEKEALKEKVHNEKFLLETRKDKMESEMEAFEIRAEIEEMDAEEEAYAQLEAEEASQKTHAPPATTTMPLVATTVPPTALSLPPPLSAAAETTLQQQTQNVSGLEFVSETNMRESASPRAVAGGAIPKRPPPGLQPLAAGNAHVSSVTDNIRVPPASYAEVAYRGTNTTRPCMRSPCPGLPQDTIKG